MRGENRRAPTKRNVRDAFALIFTSLKKIFKKNLKKVLTNKREHDIINTESEREISTK